MKRLLILSIFAALALSGCTENTRARAFGGKVDISVPAGQKVIGATWKESDLWYLTESMEESYQPKVKTLQESSAFGLMEGKVIFRESK